MQSHRNVLAVFVVACLGVAAICPVIAADQASAPMVSKWVAKQLKGAQDAIGQKKYDVALEQVKKAQSVTAVRSAYDNYVIDALLMQIYGRKNDSKNLIATLKSIVQSPYATAEQLRTIYLSLAKYEFQGSHYDKALDAARQAALHGATEAEVAGLIASAKRLQADDIRWRNKRRIWETQPRRRDGPLRYLNISDDEVREIQAAVAANQPYDFVSIAGVVTGCPVEEGAACTDQVWVDLHRQGKTGGLLLSKVNNRWAVGAIQLWYLCDEALDAKRESFRSYSEFWAAKEALVDSFPSCIAHPADSAPP